MTTHIYLVGLKGSGKSTIAKLLGEQLRVDVIDGDEITNRLLDARGYESIGKVTSPVSERGMGEKGWPIMGQAETDGVEIICGDYKDKPLIWAPGGGTVAHDYVELRNINVELLKAWGKGFYLVPDPDDRTHCIVELASRVYEDNEIALKSGNMANYRHPISPEAKKITGSKLRAQEVDMEIHWDKRHELYRVAAEITIPTRDKTPEQIAEEIMRAA